MLVSVTGPVVAPLGTATTTDCAELDTAPVAGVPLKLTDFTPSR